MAYITGEKILKDLPIEDSPVDRTEAQEIVDDWVGRIGDAGATKETATSRYIVKLGATAEIGQKALRRSGYVDTGEYDETLVRADRMMRDFDKATVGPEGADLGGESDTVIVETYYD